MKKKKPARKTTTLRKDLHKRLKIASAQWIKTMEEMQDEAVLQFLERTRLDK